MQRMKIATGLVLAAATALTVLAVGAPASATARTRLATGKSSVSALDGVYRRTVTKAQDAKYEGGRAIAENYGTFVLVMDHGRFAQTQQSDGACTWQLGTVAVRGSTVTYRFTGAGGRAPNNANNKPGEVFVLKWGLRGDVLRFSPISPRGLPKFTWRRVSSTPSTRHFSHRCPPPGNALQ